MALSLNTRRALAQIKKVINYDPLYAPYWAVTFDFNACSLEFDFWALKFFLKT